MPRSDAADALKAPEGPTARIFSMFAGGWKLSASANTQFTRSAMRTAIVLLPDPDTPITTAC